MPAPAYLISKVADPVFAIFIGLSAAATRINREEKELGRSTKETIDAGFRYLLPEFRSPLSMDLMLTLVYRRIGFLRGDAMTKKN
jgi:hypothetical protein